MPAIRPAKLQSQVAFIPMKDGLPLSHRQPVSVGQSSSPVSRQPSRHKVNPPPYVGVNDRPSSSHTYKYPICPKPPSNASLGECPTVRLPQAPLVPYRHPPPFSRKATSSIHPTCARLPPVPARTPRIASGKCLGGQQNRLIRPSLQSLPEHFFRRSGSHAYCHYLSLCLPFQFYCQLQGIQVIRICPGHSRRTLQRPGYRVHLYLCRQKALALRIQYTASYLSFLSSIYPNLSTFFIGTGIRHTFFETQPKTGPLPRNGLVQTRPDPQTALPAKSILRPSVPCSTGSHASSAASGYGIQPFVWTHLPIMNLASGT